MNSLLKHVLVGVIVGGILPAMLHPLKITVFVSLEDILAHTIGAIIGALTGLVIYKIRNK